MKQKEANVLSYLIDNKCFMVLFGRNHVATKKQIKAIGM